jgi:uncharacterized protein (UPF0332 family)
MNGRAFLDLARDLAAGGTEAYWRGAVGRAYYALMLEGRDALFRWQFALPPHQSVHAWVRLRFVYAGDADVKEIGYALERLARLRNRADYDLTTQALFANAAGAVLAVQDAEGELARLDALEADSARLAAAVATIQP